MDVINKFAELKAQNNKALLAFLPGNYPTPQGFKDAVHAVFEGGADILEVGIPFSEPLADGPVIAEAYFELLERKENIFTILDSVKELSTKYPDKAFVIMSYANPLLAMGETGKKALQEAGVSAVIVPDIPFEGRDIIEDILPEEVKVVAMLAPTTSDARRKQITSQAKSFVYCVAVTGVTGERKDFVTGEVDFLKDLHNEVNIPIVVGFGIATAEHARAAARYADGVVVGSKITRLANAPLQLKSFVIEIKAAIKTT
jgi:tryptophan synthase alpha chain